VRRIVKYFGWKPVTILGHSLGAAIGFLYAAMYPEETAKVLQVDLISPTIRGPETVASNSAAAIDKFLKYEDLSEKDMPCYEYNVRILVAVLRTTVWRQFACTICFFSLSHLTYCIWNNLGSSKIKYYLFYT